MVGRFFLFAFLLWVSSSVDVQAKLSTKDKKALKGLHQASVTTFAQTSFSVQTHTESKTTLGLLGFQFTSEEKEEQETNRVLKSGGRVDFYGYLRTTETDPFDGPKTSTVEEVVIGDDWWAREDEEGAWTQPDAEDPENADLIADKDAFMTDATGSVFVDVLDESKVLSIKTITATSKTNSCFQVVPTEEAMLEEAGGDDFVEEMIKKGTYHSDICVDTETGFLSSSTIVLGSGGFTVKVEGFEATVKQVDVKSETKYSKFGEPVEFPDVSPPSVT